MATIALVLNEHSVPDSPLHGAELNSWGKTLKDSYEAVEQLQPQLKVIRGSAEWKSWYATKSYELQGVNPTLRSWLLKKIVSPYLALEDEDRFADDYLSSKALITAPLQIHESEPAKVAHLYGFALVSANFAPWNVCFLQGEVVSGETNLLTRWRNVSDDTHPAACHSEYFERLAKPTLAKSAIAPDKKRVYFQDHHGKDVLEAFAPKLRNFDYVEEIESGEWKSQARRFVYEIYQHQGHWFAHLVLYKTDRGYSFLVRTTARNRYEAELIGEELTKLYR